MTQPQDPITTPVDPLSVMCPACLAGPGEPCYATSTTDIDSETTRPFMHKLRGLAAAKMLQRCEHCSGIGWMPIPDPDDDIKKGRLITHNSSEEFLTSLDETE